MPHKFGHEAICESVIVPWKYKRSNIRAARYSTPALDKTGVAAPPTQDAKSVGRRPSFAFAAFRAGSCEVLNASQFFF
jgi:hypothetical protein